MLNHPQKITLADKLDAFTEHWRPHIVAEMNGQEIKVAKFQGEFVWHQHDDTDELFWVISGHMRIEFRTHTVALGPGEIIVVPRGVEHRPVAEEEVQVVLFEAANVVNTGTAAPSEMTAPMGARL
ncbi:MAG: cupin domain-containing protein [Rhodothermales bacterium]